MSRHAELQMIGHRYRETFGANLSPNFAAYISCRTDQESTAALGYARAGIDPLFLEAYLDQPVETLVSAAYSRPVARTQIIEIGNFAAVSPQAMILLWGAAANDLSALGEIAVATLTRPLRHMFRRIGVPIVEIAEARADRLGPAAADWGGYFDQDPRICTGVISDGQQAINAFLDRRFRREVA
ncbi:thermostable hemolysin [Sphingopyxis sp.]|uniref:thermostable hemolysin n=1 Tax=Sphingopyxis sp. TaxID=1908224 RepID=UPI003BAD1778